MGTVNETVNKAVLEKLEALQERTDLLWDGFDDSCRKSFNTNLDDPQLQETLGLMCDIFIELDGSPNYDNIIWFRDHSNYEVIPGEVDSFGWLSAGIRKPNGPVLWFG